MCDCFFLNSHWFKLTLCIRLVLKIVLLNGKMKGSILVNRKVYCFYDRLKYSNYNDDIVPKIILNTK